jgi:hypothetical protein
MFRLWVLPQRLVPQSGEKKVPLKWTNNRKILYRSLSRNLLYYSKPTSVRCHGTYTSDTSVTKWLHCYEWWFSVYLSQEWLWYPGVTEIWSDRPIFNPWGHDSGGGLCDRTVLRSDDHITVARSTCWAGLLVVWIRNSVFPYFLGFK